MENTHYDVLIIGGGVSGTALLYTLAHYSTIPRIALLEKRGRLAQVSSKSTNNSQTLHFGDIETNYDLEKARQVSRGARMVQTYITTVGKDEGVFAREQKMVLGVGDEEVERIRERVETFRELFPNIEYLDRATIAEKEPALVDGRNPDEPIAALFSPDGYIVNFETLSQSFAKHATVPDGRTADVLFNEEVIDIQKDDAQYRVITRSRTFTASVVVVDACGYSMWFAKKMGYAKDQAVLPMGGSFFHAPKMLRGKVYTVQSPGLPFAAIHGDPDLDYPEKMRFGPIAKVLFLLERYNYSSVWPTFRVLDFSPRTLQTLVKLLFTWKMSGFLLKHFVYDLPWVGKFFYIKEVQKIVPSLRVRDIRKAKKVGGARPQFIDKEKRWLGFGNARIQGDRIIFNVTPSPGASTCLNNAFTDAKTIVEEFESSWQFDEARFLSELLPNG